MNLFEKEAFLREISDEFENKSAEELLSRAIHAYPNIVLACSFGAEDVVLVDMLQKINRNVPIFYLDTDLHFKETYETRDRLSDKYGIEFIQVKSKLTLVEQAQKYAPNLWESQPDLCCQLRKVEPLTRILSQFDAWITGIRREQSATRVNARKAVYDLKFGLAKLNPLADWTYDRIWEYIRSHDVPYNALHDRQYPSVGCEKCTKPVLPGEDPRSGRWAGFEKTECGLHK